MSVLQICLSLILHDPSSFSLIVPQNIEKPSRDDWGTGLEAMEAALALEKRVNQSLLDLHKVAGKHNDYQVG